jgi:thymidylate synthase
MGIEIVSASSFGELVEQAKSACAEKPLTSLVLGVQVSFPVLDDVFIHSYIDRGKKWQQPERPKDLYLNHGEYINRHGDGLEFLIQQLKDRPRGNRACISLMDTGELIGSGDQPRPSFMLVQAGFSELGRSVLHMAAYYRALEVSNFLPVNLAEMALMSSKIQSEITEIEHLDLTIFAFRAYQTRGFTRLERSKFDLWYKRRK